MALIEASACARPVVASDVGGIREVVSNDVSGTLMPPGDIPAIADSVINLLEDPRRRARMGQAGRILVEERFSMSSWARQLARIYTEATAGQHANAFGTSSP
jgi:glycosyltransferase involved in cell wall biosynthesis